MVVERQNAMQITLVDDEIDLFIGVVKKILSEKQRAGFKKAFTQEELELIENFIDED